MNVKAQIFMFIYKIEKLYFKILPNDKYIIIFSNYQRHFRQEAFTKWVLVCTDLVPKKKKNFKDRN